MRNYRLLLAIAALLLLGAACGYSTNAPQYQTQNTNSYAPTSTQNTDATPAPGYGY